MRAIVALSLLAGLSGCVPYAQRVSNTCEGMGYQPGTALFLSCFQGQEQTDAYDRAAWGQVTAAGLNMATPRPVIIVPRY